MLDFPVDIPFRDRGRAAAILHRISTGLPEEQRRRLENALAGAADPDASLQFLDRLRAARPDAFERFGRVANSATFLFAIFSSSRFLSQEVIQHPEWLEQLLASGQLVQRADSGWFQAELQSHPALGSNLEAVHLAEFRRRQLLRILLRDVLGYADLSEVTTELSALADCLLHTAYLRLREKLAGQYGEPQISLPSGELRECGLSILGLGKLGGQELNYSSDIDLMFIYDGPGETSGPERITNKEFFKKLCNQLTAMLSAYTQEGLCYRVDLRLRPDGRLGEVCITLDAAKQYYAQRARDWELQMLIKARVCAGADEPGSALLDFVEPRIYASSLDFSAVEAMSQTRERINEKLQAKRRAEELDIKLARGGIRDIEFLVQCLQRLHGGREPWVRHGGTLLALSRLRDKDLLSAAEYSQLACAYEFLRTVEHRLQFFEDRQTHTLPSNAEELSLIARRMPVGMIGEPPSGDGLLAAWREHSRRVIEIYERVIHAQQPVYFSPAAPAPSENPRTAAPPMPANVPSNIVRFLDQRAPKLAAAVGKGDLRRGYRRFEQFLEKISSGADWLKRLEANQTAAGYVLDLFEHSPYLSEQLMRDPSLIEELERLGATETPAFPESGSAGDLRTFYRRRMFRIQAESCCLAVPVFTTLECTSDLADSMIAAAYRLAVMRTVSENSPATPGYAPSGQMMVIALGRLGLREFDLASDADLLFVLRDEDRHEQVFWTRVAERLIEVLGTYTKQGVIFAVDTRLRPSGREGALVQSETAYHQYFAGQAAAWEGIAYMKARAVAGDLDAATEFLNALQQVDWRRYGQGGRSRRDLKEMRLRLEKELGASNPLKAGRGGYYDIDFALMYLRLKGAGMFFKVLNTPERIDIVEKMGHLDREDAELMREAATFYRAVDHGLRLLTGHAEGALPHGELQLEMVSQLVRRWTPGPGADIPLRRRFHDLQDRARQFFDRLFQ